MSSPGRFDVLAASVARGAASPRTFFCALLLVVAWAATGPLFGFGTAWQIFINTGTTIVTFLMVFLLQNSGDRDTRGLHAKVDELIRAIPGAHDALIGVERPEVDTDAVVAEASARSLDGEQPVMLAGQRREGRSHEA